MRKKIAAFGEVMMRLQVPGYELLSQANTLKYSFSGTGVNVAAALSHLGHEGLLISTLPENSVGDAALSYIQKLGVQTSLVSRAWQICRHVLFRKWIWRTCKPRYIFESIRK